MATSNPVPQERGATDLSSIGDKRSDIPHHAHLLGLDGDGCVHYHSPRADRVWVVDPAPDAPVASVLTHEQHTPDIWDWIDHTERARGEWRDLRYDRGSWVEALAKRLTEAER